MRLATLRIDGGTVAARIEGNTAVLLAGITDVGDLLRREDLATAARSTGRVVDLATADLAPVVPHPGKIVCVGLNYRAHILEMGREIPQYPTLFTKFAEALVGPYDDIALPPESDKVDWEGELAVVVGRTVRRARSEEAREAIAGFSVLNDITMRDWQYRTTQWFQGKAWENSTPIGPVLSTPDEIPADAELVTSVDDDVVQRVPVADLVFSAQALVEYVSTIVTLRPGDVIATGTPGGVGHARKPARYLSAGQRVRTRIDGIGELSNLVVPETISAPAGVAG